MASAHDASSSSLVSPAGPITSGSALRLLTTAGVPLASASSADSTNVSTGPEAIATSAVAERGQAAAIADVPQEPDRQPSRPGLQ